MQLNWTNAKANTTCPVCTVWCTHYPYAALHCCSCWWIRVLLNTTSTNKQTLKHRAERPLILLFGQFGPSSITCTCLSWFDIDRFSIIIIIIKRDANIPSAQWLATSTRTQTHRASRYFLLFFSLFLTHIELVKVDATHKVHSHFQWCVHHSFTRAVTSTTVSCTRQFTKRSRTQIRNANAVATKHFRSNWPLMFSL